MTDGEQQARDLESALLSRARALAREHVDKAHGERERLLAECGERLRLREEREILAAKQDAERVFRRRVQAAEIRLQGELDRLRWGLVQGALHEAGQRLSALAADDARYLPLLKRWIAQACAAIPEGDLVAELCPKDRGRLAARWDRFCAEAAEGRTILLADSPCEASGGVVVYSADRSVRIDNSFEGRLERLREPINEVILERLFAAVPDMEHLHG